MGQPIQEPSMEDILASIKRIIAEDGEAAPPPPPRVRRGPVAVPDPEPEPESVLPPQDAEPEIEEAEEPAPEPVAEALPEEEPEVEPDVLELTSPMVAPFGWQPASILSADAEQASRHAFAALAQAPRETPPHEGAARGQTIEAFVGDMLRPMLSDWLDRELPAIVERIVTAEVRRLSGRG